MAHGRHSRILSPQNLHSLHGNPQQHLHLTFEGDKGFVLGFDFRVLSVAG